MDSACSTPQVPFDTLEVSSPPTTSNVAVLGSAVPAPRMNSRRCMLLACTGFVLAGTVGTIVGVASLQGSQHEKPLEMDCSDVTEDCEPVDVAYRGSEGKGTIKCCSRTHASDSNLDSTCAGVGFCGEDGGGCFRFGMTRKEPDNILKNHIPEADCPGRARSAQLHGDKYYLNMPGALTPDTVTCPVRIVPLNELIDEGSGEYLYPWSHPVDGWDLSTAKEFVLPASNSSKVAKCASGQNCYFNAAVTQYRLDESLISVNGPVDCALRLAAAKNDTFLKAAGKCMTGPCAPTNMWNGRYFTSTVSEIGTSCHPVGSVPDEWKAETLIYCEPLAVEGRPLPQGQVTNMKWESCEDQDEVHAPSYTLQHHYSHKLLQASTWMARGAAEHASVASVALNALELMSVGAPLHLLSAVSKAMSEEVVHAKEAWQVAALLSGKLGKERVAPGTLDLKDVYTDIAIGNPQRNTSAIVYDTWTGGVIGETGAAVRAAQWLVELREIKSRLRPEDEDVVAINAAAAAIERVAVEEAGHAGLAWKVIRWAVLEEQFASESAAHMLSAEVGKLQLNKDAIGEQTPETLALRAAEWVMQQFESKSRASRDAWAWTPVAEEYKNGPLYQVALKVDEAFLL